MLLWVGRAQEEYHRVCAVSRREGEDAQGEAALWNFHAGVVAVGGLAAGVRGNARGYGIHGGVLEAGVEHPGGAV